MFRVLLLPLLPLLRPPRFRPPPSLPCWTISLLLTMLLLLPSSHAHFSLTFPQARYPPFDFLETQRTIGPCGVPKSMRSPTTQFQTQRPYTLSWRMAMEHKGTFRFFLMDSEGKRLENGILNSNGTVMEELRGENVQSAKVLFPVECRNCTLVAEKDGPGERGCAEVDIQVGLAKKPCSGNGKPKGQGQSCRCERGFSGEQCQHREECVEDAECAPGGRCLANSVHSGQRSCFCQFGRFGPNCEKSSDPDPGDQACFSHNGPRPDFGSSSSNPNQSSELRLGLFNPSCYSSKKLNSDGDTLFWRLVGDQLELVLDFRTNSWLALGWRPLHIPPSCRLFPQIHSLDSRDEDSAKSGGFARGVLDWPLHPMDCVDLVMASVRDHTLLHISDLYSRDRSSPLKDDWLDGEQSLSSAYGLAQGDRTVVMFRRMVPEIEPTDHPLGPGEIFVIWAKGQPRSKDGGNFYSDGLWKYHGNGGGRGHLQAELVTSEQMATVRGPLVHLDPVDGTEVKGRVGAKKKTMTTMRVTETTEAKETERTTKTEETMTERTTKMMTEGEQRQPEEHSEQSTKAAEENIPAQTMAPNHVQIGGIRGEEGQEEEGQGRSTSTEEEEEDVRSEEGGGGGEHPADGEEGEREEQRHNSLRRLLSSSASLPSVPRPSLAVLPLLVPILLQLLLPISRLSNFLVSHTNHRSPIRKIQI